MQLSRFEPSEPPSHVKQIITDLILLQRYRYLKIDKPSHSTNVPLTKPQTQFKSFEKVVEPLESIQIKRKIMKKVKSQQINIKKQKKAQRLFNLQLLHRLNESVLQSVEQREPPLLSVLDTKEEGDYLADGDKKEYPHFSNTLKPTQIPHQKSGTQLPRPKKITKFPVFTVQDNCVYKIKQIYKFPKLLFRLGNEEFQSVAAELSLSTSSVKLLYDLFNDYFNIQDRIDLKSHEQKTKYLKRVKKYLFKAFNKYKKVKQKSSFMYIPMEQQFMSLRQIRDSLYTKRQESESSSED